MASASEVIVAKLISRWAGVAGSQQSLTSQSNSPSGAVLELELLGPVLGVNGSIREGRA